MYTDTEIIGKNKSYYLYFINRTVQTTIQKCLLLWNIYDIEYEKCPFLYKNIYGEFWISLFSFEVKLNSTPTPVFRLRYNVILNTVPEAGNWGSYLVYTGLRGAAWETTSLRYRIKNNVVHYIKFDKCFWGFLSQLFFLDGIMFWGFLSQLLFGRDNVLRVSVSAVVLDRIMFWGFPSQLLFWTV